MHHKKYQIKNPHSIGVAFASLAPNIALAPTIPAKASFFSNPFAIFEARVHGRDMPDRKFSHNLLSVRKFLGVIRLMACFLGMADGLHGMI